MSCEGALCHIGRVSEEDSLSYRQQERQTLPTRESSMGYRHEKVSIKNKNRQSGAPWRCASSLLGVGVFQQQGVQTMRIWHDGSASGGALSSGNIVLQILVGLLCREHNALQEEAKSALQSLTHIRTHIEAALLWTTGDKRSGGSHAHTHTHTRPHNRTNP